MTEVEDITRTKIVKGFTIEPLGDGKYLVGKGKNWSLQKATEVITNKKREYMLTLDNDTSIPIKPFINKSNWNVPSDEDLQSFCEGKIEVKSEDDIFFALINTCKTLIDLKDDKDYVLVALYILQTYFTHSLNSVFYLSADGDLNVGKTTVLEVCKELGYRYILSKTISGAGIMRTIQREGVNLGCDEIDQISNREMKADVEGTLRGGQRKGSAGQRMEKIDGEFVTRTYNTFGAHSYTLRSGTEDALQSRTYCVEMARSTDHTLPIINHWKVDSCRQVFLQLFLLRATKYSSQVALLSDLCSDVDTCSEVWEQDIIPTHKVHENRRKLYEKYTKHFDPETKEYMETLFGRDNEMFYIISNLASLTKINLFDYLKKIAERKKRYAEQSEDLYESALQTFLRETYVRIENLSSEDEGLKPRNKYKLTRGDNKGKLFYPLSLLNKEFAKYLREHNIHHIGDNRKDALMRKIGFSKDKNWKVKQRFDGMPQSCIIFDVDVMSKLFIGKYNLDTIDKDKEKKDGD